MTTETKKGKDMTLSGWLTFGLAVMAILAWYASIFVGYRKDTIRASEQDIVLKAFIQKQNSNEDLLAKAMGVLAAQKTLVVYHNDDGQFVVRTVESVNYDLVKKLIERELIREGDVASFEKQ